MKARHARPSDAPAIHRLIAHYAQQGLLLPREKEEIRRHADHFIVLVEQREIFGCVSLESYGSGLAEIRSLAVDPAILGRGLGARLITFALEEARRRGMARLFAVTHNPEFFRRQGFEATERRSIPEKIARDCAGCLKRRSCHLAAVVADVLPQRAALPVINDSTAPLSTA